LFPYQGLGHILAFQTFHFFALAANDWRVDACVQVIFLDSDGRLLGIDDPQVKDRTDKFAKMATCTFLAIDTDSHV
jgi:hypothetical protein